MNLSKYLSANAPRGRWIIAHRGNSSVYPENTMPAFHSAQELGADAIELDVHLSADGEVVVMHDHKLERTSTGTGEITALRWEYLREQDAGSWKSPAFEGTRIPLLREVFTDIDLPVMVEIKPSDPAAVRATVEVIRECEATGRAIIASFHDANIALAAELLPECERLVLGKPDMARMANAHIAGPHFSDATPGIVKDVHASKGAVWCWTADTRNEIMQVIRLGADGIISNEPARAIQLSE